MDSSWCISSSLHLEQQHVFQGKNPSPTPAIIIQLTALRSTVFLINAARLEMQTTFETSDSLVMLHCVLGFLRGATHCMCSLGTTSVPSWPTVSCRRSIMISRNIACALSTSAIIPVRTTPAIQSTSIAWSSLNAQTVSVDADDEIITKRKALSDTTDSTTFRGAG